MEFKKSRLEIDETNPSPRMSPLFNNSVGGHGGGGGGGGPHRGRYTRYSLGGGMPTTSSSAMSSTSSSRFSPYSISRDRPTPRRSIPVITARMDDRSIRSSLGGGGGGGGGLFMGGSSILGSTSSTAQKIMDTLSSMSTPVLNAGRVRIDSIKPVKPIAIGSSALNSTGTFLSSSNRFSGPPKTLSPLLLPKTPSGFRPEFEKSVWSLKCLSIPPKMVDCGTCTDNDTSAGGECDVKVVKMNTSQSPIVPKPKNSSKPAIIIPEKSHGSSRLADLIAKSRPVNGEYKFDKPWSLKDVDRYLVSDQCKKVLDRDATSSSDTTSDDINEGDEDENENEDSNMMSNHKIPNGGVNSVGGFKIKQDKDSFNKTTSSTPAQLKWSPPRENHVSFSRWECPTCMVFNGSNTVKCVCCGSSYPEETKPKPSSSPFSKIDSGKSIISPKPAAAPPAKWSCPTCMVPNEATASACVCCSEPNPEQPKTKPTLPSPRDKIDSGNSTTTGPTPTFQFGFSAAPKVAPTPVSAFGSGTTAAPTPVPIGSFKFGTPAVTTTPAFGSVTVTTAAPTPTPTSTFTFGTAPTPATTSPPAFGSGTPAAGPTSTFKFGTPIVSSTPSAFGSGSAGPTSTPSFQFGTPTASTATAAPAFGTGNTGTGPTPMFQFGNAPAQASTPAPAPAFGSNTTAGPTSVFQFQSKPNTAAPTGPSPSFQFGTPTAPAATPAPSSGFGTTGANNPFNFGATPTPSQPSNVFSFGTPNSSAGPTSAPAAGVPPPLFQFQANPSNNTGPDGRRKIKAARRNRQ